MKNEDARKEFIGLISLDPHHDDIETELTSVIAETQLKNKPSCQLLERLGMKEEERLERFGEMQVIYRKSKTDEVETINKKPFVIAISSVSGERKII